MRKDMSPIFDESNCLSEKQIMDYLNGKMNDAEMHSAEAHISNCDFCNEALEGLMQIGNKEQIPVIIKQIHNHIRRDLKLHRARRKKIKMYVWLSLVVLLILIILLIAFLAEYYVIR